MNKKKKIGIFYGGFLRNAGGAYSHAKILHEELNNRGFKVDLYTLETLPIVVRFIPHLIQKLTYIFHTPLSFIFKGYFISFLYNIFKKTNYDIIIFQDIYISKNVSSKALTILHAVWSDNLHSYNINKASIEFLKKFEARKINHIGHPVVTVSYPYKKYLEKIHFSEFPIKKNLGVVELGRRIDINYKTAKKDPFGIIFVGFLERRKRVDFLLKVFSKIIERDKRYKLTIIGGDGGQRDFLESFSQAQKLPVKFLGKLESQKVFKELAKNSHYIHTSEKESFSFALLEAKLMHLKTYAFADLQVPYEFIDVPIPDFNVNQWVKYFFKKNQRKKPNLNRFSESVMTDRLLSILKIKTS